MIEKIIKCTEKFEEYETIKTASEKKKRPRLSIRLDKNFAFLNLGKFLNSPDYKAIPRLNNLIGSPKNSNKGFNNTTVMSPFSTTTKLSFSSGFSQGVSKQRLNKIIYKNKK